MENKARIDYSTKPYKYYDKNGNEIHEHDVVQYDSGRREEIFLTDQGELGTDATNPKWIESGRAVRCEYGIYPLEHSDVESCVVIPWVPESKHQSLFTKEERERRQ